METRIHKIHLFFITLVAIQILLAWRLVGFTSNPPERDTLLLPSSSSSSSSSSQPPPQNNSTDDYLDFAAANNKASSSSSSFPKSPSVAASSSTKEQQQLLQEEEPLFLLQFPNTTDCCSTSSSTSNHSNDNPVPPGGHCPNGKRDSKTLKLRRVEYLRSQQEILEERNNTRCSSNSANNNNINNNNNNNTAIDVLKWILETLNNANENSNNNNHNHNQQHQYHLVLAYGALIRIFREKTFYANTGGGYNDDDFDMFVTPTTFQYLVTELEPIVWNKFGWTIRIFKNCYNQVVLGQIVGACGHVYSTQPDKSIQDEPSLELYPLIASSSTSTTTTKSIQQPHDNDNTNDDVVLYNVWQQGRFPKSLIFPPIIYPLELSLLSSRGHGDVVTTTTTTTTILPLQIPRHSHVMLKCWYGNWMIPSGRRAGLGTKVVNTCMEKAFLNISTFQSSSSSAAAVVP